MLGIFRSAALAVMAFGLLPHSATAETQRSARVQIENLTGQEILTARVVHKYSDEFAEELHFQSIAAGSKAGPSNSSPDKRVNYFTGFTTTGKDWWLVLWVPAGDTSGQMYFTDPANAECTLNDIEQISQVAIPIVVAGAAAVACAECGPGAAIAAAGAWAATDQLVSLSMNDTSTCGFKQHLLRCEDEGQTVTIRLYNNNVADFISPSGKSGSRVSRKSISVSNPEIVEQLATASADTSRVISARGNDGKCLHKRDGGWTNGNIIHLWDCAAGPAENKTWVWDPDTQFIRGAADASKCLHKRDGGWDNGNPIHVWDCDAGPLENKQWIYDETNGQLRASSNPGKCLHKKFGDWNNGNPIHVWDCDAGPDANKSWKLLR